MWRFSLSFVHKSPKYMCIYLYTVYVMLHPRYCWSIILEDSNICYSIGCYGKTEYPILVADSLTLHTCILKKKTTRVVKKSSLISSNVSGLFAWYQRNFKLDVFSNKHVKICFFKCTIKTYSLIILIRYA